MRSGFRKVLGCQPPMECCPSLELRGLPRTLWWVQGRLNTQPWGGEVGRIRAGTLTWEGEAGGPCHSGHLPSAEASLSRAVVCGVGHQGIWAKQHAEVEVPGPAAACVAVALRPRGRIRWLEASSGPERLFRHVGRAGSDTISVWLSQQEDRGASRSGPRGGHSGVASPHNHSSLPTSRARSARPHMEAGIRSTVCEVARFLFSH